MDGVPKRMIYIGAGIAADAQRLQFHVFFARVRFPSAEGMSPVNGSMHGEIAGAIGRSLSVKKHYRQFMHLTKI